MILSCYTKKHNMGLGDFIRGSLYIYRECKKYNLKFDISTQYNIINTYLENKTYNFKEEDVIVFNYNEKINYDFIKKICENNEFVPISSNYYYNLEKLKYEKMNEEEINYFLNKFNFNFNDININYNNFNLYHIRLSDYYFNLNNKLNKENIKKIENIILKKINKNELNILISNSKVFKDYMKKYNFIKIIDNIPIHTASSNDNINIKSILEDIYLIKNANIIFTYSEYQWISGFVFWLSQLYKKKLINLK